MTGKHRKPTGDDGSYPIGQSPERVRCMHCHGWYDAIYDRSGGSMVPEHYEEISGRGTFLRGLSYPGHPDW